MLITAINDVSAARNSGELYDESMKRTSVLVLSVALVSVLTLGTYAQQAPAGQAQGGRL